MKIVNPKHRPAWFLAFSVFLLAPSFDTALKYFGSTGVVVYFVAGTVALLFADRFLIPAYQKLVSEKSASYLALASLITLSATALIVYPIANSGRFGGGSDGDDALITAVTELLNGRYPYYLNTYLGNLISPMPGAIVLAIPFVALGLLPLQNVFWLAILFLVFRKFEESSVSALGVVWIMLFVSPTLLQNIVTGADYASNSIYVLVAMWALIRTLSHDSAEWKPFAAAVLLGVGLSSRSTFMLAMPLLLSALVQNAGWKPAIKYLVIAAITFLVVTIPFWLYDPAGFAPLRVQSDKLKAIEDFLPFASIIIPGSAMLMSVGLSFQRMRSDITVFFRNCAIVQLFVLMFTALIYTLKLGRLDFYVGQTGYGMFTLFFGAVAGWTYLYGKRSISEEES